MGLTVLGLLLGAALGAEVILDAGEPVRLVGPLSVPETLEVRGARRGVVLGPRLVVTDGERTVVDLPRDDPFLIRVLARMDVPLDPPGLALLEAYGALQVGKGRAPDTLRFPDQAAIDVFEAGLEIGEARFGERTFRLQRPAAEALTRAVAELRAENIPFSFHVESVTTRTWATSDRYWRSRVGKALKHHVAAGRLDAAEAGRIGALGMPAHMEAVLDWETRGVWFHPDLDRSLLRWAAPAGTSQHHSLLAVDLTEPSPAVVAVMARHGFLRTVRDDDDHFSWLGLTEAEAARRGLKRMEDGGAYWVVDLGGHQ